jgi:hypothetical protein
MKSKKAGHDPVFCHKSKEGSWSRNDSGVKVQPITSNQDPIPWFTLIEVFRFLLSRSKLMFKIHGFCLKIASLTNINEK